MVIFKTYVFVLNCRYKHLLTDYKPLNPESMILNRKGLCDQIKSNHLYAGLKIRQWSENNCISWD